MSDQAPASGEAGTGPPPQVTGNGDGIDSARSREYASKRQSEMKGLVASVVGWFGFSLGLLNVYPTLFAWHTAADRMLGTVICVLTAGLVARFVHLLSRDELDVPASLLTFAILVLIAATSILGNV